MEDSIRPSRLWVNWLTSVTIGVVVFGLVLVLAPVITRQGFSLLVYASAEHIETFGPEQVRQISLVQAVIGGVMVGRLLPAVPPSKVRATRELNLRNYGMEMHGIPFGTTDWAFIPRTEHKGETGTAYWRTCHFGSIRVRMVEYTPGYLADHWCVKGHILFCIEGVLHTELQDGRTFALTPGMSYQVADNAEPHRSKTAVGAKLFVVD